MSARNNGGDAAAFVRAKEQIAERRKEQDSRHTVVEGQVIYPNGQAAR
jgi:hypothetical protein